MSNKKFGLLDESLQPQFKENIVYDVPIKLLKPYANNEFEMSEVDYLANDIKLYGQKTPIQVCIDTMSVVDGEQRYRAMLKNDSKTIKAIFKKYEDEADRKIAHYKANEHRKNIKPSSLAHAIYDISLNLEKRGFTKGQIEEHLGSHYGYADRTIRRYLALHSLDEDTKKKFDTGEYKMRDVEKIKNGDISKEKEIKDSEDNIYIKEVQNTLQQKLANKVIVKSNYIKIPISSKEDMNNLLERINSLID